MKQNNRKKNKKQKNIENKSEKKEYLYNEFISFNIDNEKIDKMFNFRKDTVEKYKNEKKVELKNYFENHNIWREIWRLLVLLSSKNNWKNEGY